MIGGFVIFAVSFVTLSLILERLIETRQHTGFENLQLTSDHRLKGELVSHSLRVYGTPDAVIEENGQLIPVERKSFSKKLRSRHIIQAGVYMILVQDVTGKPCNKSYLILGKNYRRKVVRLKEDLARKIRLKARELINVLEGLNIPVADPYPKKCRTCVVQDFCDKKVIT